MQRDVIVAMLRLLTPPSSFEQVFIVTVLVVTSLHILDEESVLGDNEVEEVVPCPVQEQVFWVVATLV